MTQANGRAFERLVAAIHRAADAGATVQWNEIINGRQFDVTIRFRRGLYDHLTVVECKDYGRKVGVDKVDALATKARDSHANVAVLASSAGFQSGAVECAKRHDITLLHITDSEEIGLAAFGLSWGEPTLAHQIYTVKLIYPDGAVRSLQEAPGALEYYVKHVILEHGTKQTSLECQISHYIDGVALTEMRTEYRFEFSEGTDIRGPNDGEVRLGPVTAMVLEACYIQAKTIKGPYRVDPSVLIPDVSVVNVHTGEETSFKFRDLALGLDDYFLAGCFYEAPGLGYFYFCQRVENALATVHMIESFQLGMLVQLTFTVEAKYGKLYLPVKDVATLERLKRRLQRFLATV